MTNLQGSKFQNTGINHGPGRVGKSAYIYVYICVCVSSLCKPGPNPENLLLQSFFGPCLSSKTQCISYTQLRREKEKRYRCLGVERAENNHNPRSPSSSPYSPRLITITSRSIITRGKERRRRRRKKEEGEIRDKFTLHS